MKPAMLYKFVLETCFLAVEDLPLRTCTEHFPAVYDSPKHTGSPAYVSTRLIYSNFANLWALRVR